MANQHFGVVGFRDSDYAGCMDDKKSTSGYIFMMTEGAFSWKSVKQTLIAFSTIEVVYVTCYEVTCHAIWLRNSFQLWKLFTLFLDR